jgi:alkylation response protein AidB-like acyl-CoA dehydrogenase
VGLLSREECVGRARAIAESVVKSNAAANESLARWPEEDLRALQDARLGGLVVPIASGGLGHGLVALTEVCEELAVFSPSTALCFGMHSVGAAVIAAKATDRQRKAYLEPIAAGKHLTTLALSEPGTGAHFYFPQTQIEAKADGFEVTGQKAFVTNGGHADSYVVSTRASAPGSAADEFSCVLVQSQYEGLEWGPPWSGLGMRSNSSRSLLLRGVHVKKDDLLGAEGDQIWYVFHVVAPYFLTAMSGTYLGIARAAFEEARRHLRARRYEHSGARLSQQPVLQHRLGTLWAAWQRTRCWALHAATLADAAMPDALPAVLATKAEVADCVVHVVNEAMTLCGGVAYQQSSLFGRLLHDARAAHVMAPTTDLLRLWTGRALLEEPILGD